MTGTGVTHIHVSDTCCLNSLTEYLGEETPEVIALLGNPDILQGGKLAIFCSSRCPGSLILQVHELIQTLRQSALTFVGSFHSPVERECLTLLLQHQRPITYCLARSLDGMRIRQEYRQALKEGPLVFLSPFMDKPRRPTASTAFYRNRVAAALADVVLVPHAEPGGKTEELCREVLSWGKPLFTLSSDHNENLIAMGARAVLPDSMGAVIEAVSISLTGTDSTLRNCVGCMTTGRSSRASGFRRQACGQYCPPALNETSECDHCQLVTGYSSCHNISQAGSSRAG